MTESVRRRHRRAGLRAALAVVAGVGWASVGPGLVGRAGALGQRPFASVGGVEGRSNPPANQHLPSTALQPGHCGVHRCASPCWAPKGSSVVATPETTGCLDLFVEAFDRARASEGLGPLVLPTNFLALSVPDQVFVLSNLERSARGLPAMVGTTASLDALARRGAEAGRDPKGVLSVWAGGYHSALGAVFTWIYDDGWHSPNVDCRSPGGAGCWGHRDAILLSGTATYRGVDQRGVLAGVGMATRSANGWSTSLVEVVAPSAGRLGDLDVAATGHEPHALAFAWSAERGDLPACERGDRDTCRTELPVVEPGHALGERREAGGAGL